jgi:imidazolonepropionase-like amidohydrolase
VHPQDVTVENLGDVTVLPGLVDAHQHLTWDCSPEPAAWHRGNADDALLERGRENARRALAAGITTVRDLGARGHVIAQLREECAADPAAGPTLIVSGPALTTPGGHCHFLGGECAGAAELVAAVARQAESGVDVIKVMATGGNVTPGSLPHGSEFGADELQAGAAKRGTGPGGHCGASQQSSAVDLPPHIDTSDQPLPGPATTTLRPASAPRKTNAFERTSQPDNVCAKARPITPAP